MRREAFVTVLLTSVVVFAGATACNKPPSEEPDTVSGCRAGARRVKVLIDLQPTREGHCVPEVTPASVCVAPAGEVAFRIHNGCQSLNQSPNDPARPAIEIGQPKFKRKLDGKKDGAPDLEIFQNCSLRVSQLDKDASHALRCSVHKDAVPGFYKYGLSGQIEPLDPDVEVHPGDQ